MFEDSLIASQVAQVSQTKRWTMAGSIVLQTAVATLFVVLPLMNPERLTFHENTPLLFTPPPPKPPVVQAQAERSALKGTSSTALPIEIHPTVPILTGSTPLGAEQPPFIGPVSLGNDMTGGLTDALGRSDGHGTGVEAALAQPPATPRHVSEGVLAGMLLSPIRPVYPPIAKAAGISGTVIVEAVISKTGIIESLHVVSGPEMLRRAAIDAIHAARYEPFRLNGEPTEVETTITVNFRLSS